jgi:plasmid stability protein
MVASMPTLTIKDLPRQLHRQLKKRAQAHHRSLNREVLATLDSAASQSRPVDPGTLIREARAVRRKFKRQVSPAQVRAWMRRGRA